MSKWTSIDVTRDDIRAGKPDCEKCPISLAVRRAFPKAEYICVDAGEIVVDDARKRRQKKAPGPTAKYRAKRRRAEDKVEKAVRAACVERDGYCRVWRDDDSAECPAMCDCDGPSEWAHLENQRRGRTRGMKPELRHTTAGTAMLCHAHHTAYDAGTLRIVDFTGKGADGPLTWRTA